jgi:hypothetical protein
MIEEEIQETPVAETSTTTEENAHEATESQAAVSFRDMRKKIDLAKRESDRIARELEEAARERDYYKSLIPKNEPQEKQYSVGDDELVEGRHLRASLDRINKFEKEFAAERQKIRNEHDESRTRAEFPNFDEIVNEDSLAELRSKYPEIAQSINSNPTLYGRAKAAYQLIKNFNIGQKDSYDKEDEAIRKNSAKPKPSNSISPQSEALANANLFAGGLTKESKKRIYLETMKIINSR